MAAPPEPKRAPPPEVGPRPRVQREAAQSRRSQVAAAPIEGETSGTHPRPADLLAAQRAAGNSAVARSLTVQRGDPPPSGGGTAPPAASQLDPADAFELAFHQVELSTEDEKTLAEAFPNGFSLRHQSAVMLSLQSGTSLDFVRIAALEVVAPAPLMGGVEAYIFKVGKGRSILLSSIGGRSIMLDAGSGTSLSANAAGVRRLVAAVGLVTGRLAAVPETIRISHPDADHYNAVRSLLTSQAFSATSVEVAAAQLRGAGSFTRASLTVQPSQRVIAIEVIGSGGSGVHVRRSVVDNLEITEFRSVAPHAAAAATAGETYDRNRTSPVTVVTDLITGERSLYTADARGRQFDEVVDSVGRRAFARLLGADARNLRFIEAPHHGGEQKGPDAAGYLRMLQLAFEASDGSIRVVTQTSASFAARSSSSLRFLDDAGVTPERVGPDPGRTGTTEVVRARGARLAQVTVDTSGVREVLDVARANEGALQQTYARLAQLAALRAEAGAMAEGLSRSQAPPSLLSSVDATHKELIRQELTLRAAADATWDAMRTAAAGSAGMRAGRDMSDVTARLTALGPAIAANDPATSRRNLEVHGRGMSAYARVYVNVVQMVAALDAGRYQDVHRLRAEQLQLLRGVRGVLGGATVDEHVRGAWEATRGHWTTARIQAHAETMASRTIHRRVNTEFRATLGETLARQLQLNDIAAQAGHAGRQVYGPGGRPVTPASTRVTAGIFAALEVVRLGLDIAESAHAASEAADLEQIRQTREGVGTVNWWMRRGVMPQLALVKAGAWNRGRFGVVSDGMSQDAMRAVVRSETPPPGTPDFDKVVVERIDPDELRRMVLAFVVALPDLQAWNEVNLSYPAGGPAFKRFDDGWGVRLWSAEDKQYRYHLFSDISTDLDQLMAALEASQEDRMSVDLAKAGPGTARSVEDSAILGTDRHMYVYGSGGAWMRIDCEDFSPLLIPLGEHIPPRASSRDSFTLVAAADARTYKYLSKYWWVTVTGRSSIGRGGTQSELSLRPNTEAFAYVEPDELIRTVGSASAEAAARMRNPGIRPNASP